MAILEERRCKFQYKTYSSDDMSYMVCIYKTVPQKGSVAAVKFTAVGSMLPVNKNAEVVLKGHTEQSKKYGEQFIVEEMEEIPPTDSDELVQWLVDCKVKGLGKARAAKFVKKFGDKTLDIIENEPEQLTQFIGINSVKAQKISEGYKEKKAMRSIFTEVKKYGCSTEVGVKVYEKYKEQSVEKVRENPYILCFIKGVAFATIDTVMKTLAGFVPDKKERIEAAINEIMEMNEMDGNLFIEPQALLAEVQKLLKLQSTDKIKPVINGIIKSEKLTYKNSVLYRNTAYEAEMGTAEQIVRILKPTPAKVSDDKISELIKAEEEKLGIKLAERQEAAVRASFTSQVAIITGGPGCGKTTTINSIIHCQKAHNPKIRIALCAPTGRAASRMSEATGEEARTIHSMLEIKSDELVKPEPIEADMVIIDEFSMCDQFLSYMLFEAIRAGTKVIIVGDPDQLPSVRAGNVLHELIMCKMIPVITLNVEFRQAEGSSIIENAAHIREGEKDLNFDGRQTILFECSGEDVIAASTVSVMKKALLSYSDGDVQVLTPYRKNLKIGADSLNTALQNLVNPESQGLNQTNTGKCIWRVGDKVMMLQNKEEAKNGDTGRVVGITKTEDGTEIKVRFDFDNTEVGYTATEMNDLFNLNYACTIHKSQGSEYPVVIIPMSNLFNRMLKRNLIYTGLTRAKERVIFVGEKSAIEKAISTIDTTQRKTYLAARIVNECTLAGIGKKKVPLIGTEK